MNPERLFKVIVAPLVSEKSTRVAEKYRQFAFEVAADSSKSEIKQAIEYLFKVTVTGVQVSWVKGKRKNFGRVRGRRSDWKKAYVSLAAGQDIHFNRQ